MIYLFNDVKELTGTVRNNHILNLLYEREKNGIYSVSAEIPVTYNDQGTIYNYNKKIQKSDFLGHYDKEGRFQLHKIAAVDIENGSIFVKGIHIFFDEAKAGAIIQDRRFINREIIDGARVAFESIGWSVADFDVSVGKTYNFYNVTPLEARQILVETFGFEFDYWLDFDGKKVTNRHVAVKEKIGEKTNKRYTYGHNVLNIRAEQDYSEIYTAVIGRGKGEEIEETGGYGRRIEYTDVVWTTPSKPLNKPAGTRILEDPIATQLFGYKENGVVKPRVKVEVFSDIESPTELIQASYEWLMDNNVPKAVFSLKVADGDGLNLGDEVYVIYRDIDLIKSSRVEKVTDDLVSGNRDVEFGDTAYFDTDRRLSGLRSDLKRYSGETGDRIYRLKMEFNRRFDEEVSSWVAEFEQNLIDQKALIEADRENMTNLIEGTRTEWTESFDASVAEAHRLREENYAAMSDYVNTSVDTTRSDLESSIASNIAETERKAQLEHDAIEQRVADTVETTREELELSFGNSVESAKQYAEQQAQEKANAVRTDLGDVTIGHQALIDGLKDNVIDIDTFLGDKSKTLNQQFDTVRKDFGTLQTDLEGVESDLTATKTDLQKQLDGTRTALEGKIATTEEALNKVGEDLGSAKTDLQNQLDEARAELDGLEVGGRNLLIMNDLNLSRHSNTEVDIENGLISGFGNYYFIIENVNMKADTFYTFSYESSISNRLSFLIRNKESGGIQYIWNAGILPPDEKVTFKVPENVLSETENYHMWVYISNSENIEWQVEKIQLEKGTFATDWSPAPEDTEQKITNINQTITSIEGELSSKVEQNEVDALKGTVTDQGTLLTQTAGELSSKAEKSVVDTLTGRVSNAESSVTQNAEEIAKRLTKSVYDSDKKATDAKITQWSNTASETAEGLTRVIGRVSETEQGIDTAQTRIEAEAGRIDGVLSRTSKVEGQVRDAELAIEANADGLALRATKTEVEQAIDGIEVGGRNWFAKSKVILSNNLRYDDSLDLYYNVGYSRSFSIFRMDSFGLELNQKYILAYEIKSNIPELGLRTNTYINGSVSSVDNNNPELIEGEWVKVYTEPFLYHTETTASVHIYFNQELESSRDIEIRNVQINRGTLLQDYQEAPEDIDASISEVTDRVTTAEAEIKVHAGEISQKATQSELDRVTGRVSTAETSITQNADEIARRLVKSDYDTDKAKIDGDITKWSNLSTETAEGLEQSIIRLSTTEGIVNQAQADIIANADEIATKVSNSEFDSLSGKVTDNSSAITQTANELNSKVTQAEVDYSMTHIDNGSIKTVKDVASYYNSTPTVSGALLIKTNITGRAMSRVFIKGYNYATNNSNIDVVISFYNFSTSILNHSYTSTGSLNIERVRMFRDPDGFVYILLNDFDSTWKYPAVVVDRFDMSYVTDWSWGEDWEMSVVDSMPEGVENLTEVKGQDYGSIVSKHETEIVQNAKEIALKATQSDLNNVTGRVSTAESQLSVQADEISSVVGRVSDNETDISSVVQDVGSITSTVATLEGDVSTQGSQIKQANDAISSKVWQSDIHNPNIIPFTDFKKRENVERWRLIDATAVGTSYGEYIVATTYNSASSIAVRSRDIQLIAGETYTLSFVGAVTPSEASSNTFNFLYIYYVGMDNQLLPTPKRKFIGTIGTGGVHEVAEYSVTFTARETDELASILIGTRNSATGQVVSIRVKEPKLEKGSRATPYINAFSSLTQRADELSLAVQGINSSGFLSQSDIKIVPDYVQIGSQRIDGSNLGSLLRVSPSGIDAVAEAMRLSGDLYVAGDITAIAVNAARGDIAYLKTNILTADSINATHIESESIGASQIRADSVLINKLFTNSFAAGHISTMALEAVEGEFASLFAAQLSATTITAEHIGSKSITVDEIVINDAMVESIVSRSVFAEDITSRIGNFIDLNAGEIVTAGLSADVITSDHIQVETALIDKMFATSARIDRLITKTHFVNEMHAMTLNVVDLNASQIRTRLLSANTIEAEWIKSGIALVDKVFSSTAMFERMMAKNAFVTTLNAVTLDLSQLSIWRPDGVAYMQNGLVRHGFDLVVRPFYSGLVEFTGQNYQTTESAYQQFERIYLNHTAQYLKLQMVWRLSGSSPLDGEYMIINIKSDSDFTDFTSLTVRKLVRREESVFEEVVINLGRPTYRTGSISLELRRDHRNGTGNSDNQVQARTGRVWLHDWA